MSPTTTEAPAADAASQKAVRRDIAFVNWAHAMDHFVILIFPTVVIGLEVVYGRPYAELMALGTASYFAFGIFALPAGWLGDHWSRRHMIAIFFFGCGLSLAAAAAAPNLVVFAVALFALGVFAAIYHPVGTAMLIEASNARGRTLAFNGVCGNVGAALAAAVSAALASWFGWRGAFVVPSVICIASGIAYLALTTDDRNRTGKRKSVADVHVPWRLAAIMFAVYVVISICSGLVFNTISIALPKIVDERFGAGASLMAVGSLATAVFLCGALGQLAMGRLVERFPPHLLFAGVVVAQLIGIIWASYASGPALVVALAVSMTAIYGQVTVGDIVIARYTADAWRGRVYAVRFFLTFVSAGVSVSIIAFLYARGGFDLVLGTIAAVAAALVVSVLTFVVLVSGIERERRNAVQPAE
ncbi:MAG: MFS transporter [Variibacter sp.]